MLIMMAGVLTLVGAEEWRQIPGYEGFYEVSDAGRVRSVTRLIANHLRTRLFRGVMLSLKPSGNGYPVVGLLRGSGSKRVFHTVHSLVMETFVEPRPEGWETRHLDGDRRNNRVSNSCSGTPAENQHDRIAHGTALKGQDMPNAKLTDAAVREIRRSRAPATELATRFGVHRTAIGFIRRGVTWRHVTEPEMQQTG